MSKTLNVAIVGASGYTGAELSALLCSHPHVGRVGHVSRALGGTPVAQQFPTLRGMTDEVFVPPSEQAFAGCDAVFFATPHGVAMKHAGDLVKSGIVVIDLSPDFRLRDLSVFAKWYGEHASPELVAKAVYGLTESARDKIKNADIIACPGCYATAAELALIPLAAANIVCGAAIVDGKSGVSGAGRRTDRSDLLFAEQSENFKAYAVDGHRHLPEMQQAVGEFGGGDLQITFMPHLLPAARGLYVTVYAPMVKDGDAVAAVAQHWRDEMFIDVLEQGVPEIAHVNRTNRAQIAARNLNGAAAVFVALDNLQKGAAGQAVQNMNVRFGLPESAGLSGARNS